MSFGQYSYIDINIYTFKIPLLFITDTSRTDRFPENVRLHINKNGPTTEQLNIQTFQRNIVCGDSNSLRKKNQLGFNTKTKNKEQKKRY